LATCILVHCEDRLCQAAGVADALYWHSRQN
jgi:hypothetical protein